MRSLSSRWLWSLLGIIVALTPTVLRAQAPLPRTSEEASQRFVEGVFQEIRIPELLFVPEDKKVLRLEGMPVFTREKLADYPAASAEHSKHKATVHKARAVLWALSDQTAPHDLTAAVKEAREELGGAPPNLSGRYARPANENQFKAQLLGEERALASRMSTLQDALEELQASAEVRAKEPRRWQAQADLIQARLELQIAQLYEYQSMLGRMRKELVPLDPKHTGWKMVPQAALAGDAAGKLLARDAHRRLDQVMKQHPGTPYEMLAKRLKEVPIGLEWQPTK